jgi:hypothetical protein
VRTAAAVRSSLAADLLLLNAVRTGHTTAGYVSTSTSQAEDDASAAASTFLSIQPPDGASEDLRSTLSDLLDRADSVLGDVRVAGRRGDRAALLRTRDDLTAAAHALDGFAGAYG